MLKMSTLPLNPPKCGIFSYKFCILERKFSDASNIFGQLPVPPLPSTTPLMVGATPLTGPFDSWRFWQA